MVLACGAGPGCRSEQSVPPGFQGLLEYDQRVIGFEVAGRVNEVPVRRGQVVTAGTVIARLDDVLATAVRDGRLAELDAARADLALMKSGARKEDIASATAEVRGAVASETLARTEAERSATLLRAGAITKTEADRARTDLQQATERRVALDSRVALLRHGARPEEIARAEAAVQDRTALLAAENERLARYVVRAQEPGTILDVTVKPGEVAAPGTPAVMMADIEHPYAEVFVPEGKLGAIQVGARVEARVDGVSDPFHGVVEFVSPETEFTPKFLFSERERPNLVLRARIRIDDPDHRLHSGMPVFVQVAR